MENLFKGIPGVCCYQDDILITGNTTAEHLKSLESVFKVIAESGLRIKRDKCKFIEPEVRYLGHKINCNGLHPLDDKVKAIVEAPAPRNVTELKSYLGLLNYYGRFLPNLSTTLAPLHYLLKKGIVFSWGKQQTKAFEASKQLLTSSKVLAHYDPKRELILTCDASAYVVGAVLAQKDSEDNEHPIAFASRSLAPAEKNYSQLNKEALAIIFAVKRFHQYIFGRTFVIITDHRPLLGLFGPDRPIPQLASARIQRWSLALSAYKYSLVHRPGCQISNADGLSRLPLPDAPTNVPVPGDILLLTSHLAENSTVTADSIRRETIRDPILSKVMRSVQNGWQDQEHSIDMREYTKHKDELSVEMGCILWGSRVIGKFNS